MSQERLAAKSPRQGVGRQAGELAENRDAQELEALQRARRERERRDR